MNASIGPYALVDRFAVGGAAEIFRAHDTRTGTLVVIKRVRKEMEFESQIILAFEREVELSLRMRHKNLIRGLDKGSHQGRDHLVLEFVDGQDLSKVLERAAERKIKIPLPFSLYMMAEILDGLHHAHELVDERTRTPLGLVHRDLSPRNVFIAYDGKIRVADFGASIYTAQGQELDDVSGSPGYLAPEQAMRQPLDRRSDLFSVGCILYRLVCGRAAFNVEGKSDAEVLKIHAQAKLPPIPDGVPEDVRTVIETSTSRDPDERYATAARMRDALRAALHQRDNSTTELAIAALLRNLFKKEFEESRLPGSPLTF